MFQTTPLLLFVIFLLIFWRFFLCSKNYRSAFLIFFLIIYLQTGFLSFFHIISFLLICYFCIKHAGSKTFFKYLFPWSLIVHVLLFKTVRLDFSLETMGLSFVSLNVYGYWKDKRHFPQLEEITLIDFMVASTFFPTLLSGPIVKLRTLTERFRSISNQPSVHESLSAIYQISIGLTMKALSEYTNFLLMSKPRESLLAGWTNLIATLTKIYGDFAGYSLIAIGCAALAGVKLEANFNKPFLAVRFSEFWRRWHISFHDWLNDYIFSQTLYGQYPEKLRKFKFLFAITLTMIFAGLWHGVRPGYVFWGAYIALVLVLENKIYKFVNPAEIKIFNRLITFFLVLLSFVFFRSPSGRTVREDFLTLFDIFNLGHSVDLKFLMIGFSLIFIISLLEHLSFLHIKSKLKLCTAIALFLSCFYLLYGFRGGSFVYFKF